VHLFDVLHGSHQHIRNRLIAEDEFQKIDEVLDDRAIFRRK
jgi:hypothetical protein